MMRAEPLSGDQQATATTGLFEYARESAVKPLVTRPRGGFLRLAKSSFQANPSDVIVSAQLCRKLGLRGGELITGSTEKQPLRGSSGPSRLEQVSTINGRPVNEYLKKAAFDTLSVVDPTVQIRLETKDGPLSTRLLDLLAPIGFGSRCLLFAPPRSGKTILLQQIANAVVRNHPEAQLTVVLVDERPEEVTDMRRSVRAEVVASRSDRGASDHVRIAQLMLERAKRLVEDGKHAVVVLDSLTRLGRALNVEVGDSELYLQGGLDLRALDLLKDYCAAARAIEDGGSLTLLAAVDTGTGSRIDEAIVQALKGSGTVEIHLSAALAQLRLWPAVDIAKTAARKDDLILSFEALQSATQLRRGCEGKTPEKGLQFILDTLRKHETNDDLVSALT